VGSRSRRRIGRLVRHAAVGSHALAVHRVAFFHSLKVTDASPTSVCDVRDMTDSFGDVLSETNGLWIIFADVACAAPTSSETWGILWLENGWGVVQSVDVIDS